MTHQTLTGLVASGVTAYGMVWLGLAKRRLRVGMRGRCRSCGRLRETCSCRRRP